MKKTQNNDKKNVLTLPPELLVEIFRTINASCTFQLTDFANKTAIHGRSEWSKYATNLMTCSSIIYAFAGEILRNAKKMVQAILFDLIGTIYDHQDRGMYKDYRNILNAKCLEELNAFECGKVAAADIEPHLLRLFGISSKLNAKDSAILKNVVVERKDFYIEKTISALHKSGKFKLGMLINNGYWDKEKTKTTTSFIDNDPRFHYKFESCKIGETKRDAAFYLYVLKEMNVHSNDCIYIGELENCLVAGSLGIKYINVKDGDSKDAMKELEDILKMKLI